MALYDWQAEECDELSVQKYEFVILVDATGPWWMVRNQQGVLGLVPSGFMNPSEKFMCSVVALNSFDSGYPDELPFEQGDFMDITDELVDVPGWWEAQKGDGSTGLVPQNYVQIVHDIKRFNCFKDVGPQVDSAMESREVAAPVVSKPSEKSFICSVIALYSFNSSCPYELSFQEGDFMDIIDKPVDNPGWWEARKGDGSTGLVPWNYVEIVHSAEPVVSNEGTAPSSQQQAQPEPAGPTLASQSPASTTLRPRAVVPRESVDKRGGVAPQRAGSPHPWWW